MENLTRQRILDFDQVVITSLTWIVLDVLFWLATGDWSQIGLLGTATLVMTWFLSDRLVPVKSDSEYYQKV